MTLVKLVKNKSYFKRYQTKFKRRREGKTDYKQRKALITQDKTKYNAPKYRLVVRLTNKDIVCQIVSSKANGDHVITSAYSHELKKYGLKLGLTNYSAAYCTGLLVARRLLNLLGLDKKYVGQEKVDGEFFIVEGGDKKKSEHPGKRPFKCNLDVGLARTTTGNRIFGALKGACDGGLYVPHSEEGKRFPGWNQKEGKYDPAIHKKYIFGGHVSEYMKILEKDEKRYKAQFGRYIEAKIKPADLEKIYQDVHKAIRKDPASKSKYTKLKGDEKKKVKKDDRNKKKGKSFAQKRLTLKERKTLTAERKINTLKEADKKNEKKVDENVVEEDE